MRKDYKKQLTLIQQTSREIYRENLDYVESVPEAARGTTEKILAGIAAAHANLAIIASILNELTQDICTHRKERRPRF